ncbi:MAG: hypothetical protein HFF01_00845 [Erysipelotrichaceae bacterium]|nr:hypothetical protein [Erysipelotrichaceae bacterium]
MKTHIYYLPRRDILNTLKPKQKLNEKQQKLWDEWVLKDKEILDELNKLRLGQLSSSLVRKQKELQKKYFKMIREAAD